MNDRELEQLAKGLGDRAAERLDVERTATAVLERLRREPVARGWSWVQPTWLRIAAAVVVLLGAGWVAHRWVERPEPRAVLVASVGEDLSDLSVEELRELLTTLDQTLDVTGSGPADAGLEGLDERELRTLMGSLEGEG